MYSKAKLMIYGKPLYSGGIENYGILDRSGVFSAEDEAAIWSVVTAFSWGTAEGLYEPVLALWLCPEGKIGLLRFLDLQEPFVGRPHCIRAELFLFDTQPTDEEIAALLVLDAWGNGPLSFNATIEPMIERGLRCRERVEDIKTYLLTNKEAIRLAGGLVVGDERGQVGAARTQENQGQPSFKFQYDWFFVKKQDRQTPVFSLDYPIEKPERLITDANKKTLRKNSLYAWGIILALIVGLVGGLVTEWGFSQNIKSGKNVASPAQPSPEETLVKNLTKFKQAQFEAIVISKKLFESSEGKDYFGIYIHRENDRIINTERPEYTLSDLETLNSVLGVLIDFCKEKEKQTSTK